MHHDPMCVDANNHQERAISVSGAQACSKRLAPTAGIKRFAATGLHQQACSNKLGLAIVRACLLCIMRPPDIMAMTVFAAERSTENHLCNCCSRQLIWMQSIKPQDQLVQLGFTPKQIFLVAHQLCCLPDHSICHNKRLVLMSQISILS